MNVNRRGGPDGEEQFVQGDAQILVFAEFSRFRDNRLERSQNIGVPAFTSADQRPGEAAQIGKMRGNLS